MAIAFTGHRPDKLPGGYKSNHKQIESLILRNLQSIKTDVAIDIYVGGALGLDQIAHGAALQYYYAKVILVEPFKGFWRKWPIDSIEHYMSLKYHPKTDLVITLDQSELYQPWKMQKRNEYLVDHADEIWAYWDGSDGGTKNCVDYAKKKGKPIRNLFNEI